MVSSSSSPLASCGNNPAKRRKILEEILQDILGWRHINDLPKEILQDIMSRSASAKYILRYQSVCRLWKNLTSTQEFSELHRQRNGSSPDFSVLVEEMFRPIPNNDDFKVEKRLFMFEAWRGEKKVINPRRPRLRYYNPYEDIDVHEDHDSDGIIDHPIDDDEEKNIIKPRPDYNYIDAYKDEVDDEGESAMYISGSFSGLVVFQHKSRIDMPFSRKFIIMNPFTGDNVKIRVADDSTIIGQIFGIFFHPVSKEFCVLWGQTRPPQARDNFIAKEYKLLNLGPSQSRWKAINYLSTRNLLKKRQQPRILTSPIILDDVLFWMVDEKTQSNPKSCEEAILGFDTKTEEFHFLPHPSPCPCCRLVEERIENHASMHLLENYNSKNNGGVRHLSLCQFSKVNAQSLMRIWIFKKEETDHNSAASASIFNRINNGSWIKTHTIKLNDDDIIKSSQPSFRPSFQPSSQPFFRPSYQPSLLFDLRPIAMVDDELLLVKLQTLGYLFVWNMKLGTYERFESKRGSDSNTPVGGMRGTFMCVHAHNFMAMRNSNPEILLKEL